MRRYAAVLMSMAMAASLAACGGASQTVTGAAGTKATETKAAETQAAAGDTTAAAAADSSDPSQYKTDSGWPTGNNITMIVPAGAGGTLDLCARVVATELEKELGSTVVVENVPGGGMWVGWKQTLASEPDGYTFCVYNVPAVAVANYNEANPQKEGPSDFAKLCNHTVDYGALAVRADDSRFSDVDSFVEYAKENEVLCTAGSIGLSNADSLGALWFNNSYGTKITVMTVDSSSDGMARFYAGDTDCFFGSIGDLLSEKDAGVYKVIATFGPERSDLMPDVPTLKELGYDYESYVGRGFAFPAGVDQKIVDNMTKALSKACEAAEEKVRELGCETHIVTGKEYDQMEQELLERRLAIYGLTLDDKVVNK